MYNGLLGKLRRPVTVLVIDDEAVVRRLAYRMLNEHGCRVLEAADAAEALAVVQMAPHRVDAALIDVVMPGRDGASLAGELRRRWPSVRLVLMSAHPAEVIAKYELEVLSVPFLAKPFTRDELFVRLREVLGKGPAEVPAADGDPQAGPCDRAVTDE